MFCCARPAEAGDPRGGGVKKELVLVGFVGCLAAGFVAGLLVRWPGGLPVQATQKLMPPMRGGATPLVKIFEVSDFQ
jgi:fructose-specific phosphotransferase system IIC component